jgi:hypothetical protein
MKVIGSRCRSDAERRRTSLVENRERRNRKVLVTSSDEVLAGPSPQLLVTGGRG